ncbi:threonine ammonia-lyase [Phyllobacterium endophyticum]|uniref:Pyridoxal-5'-phosphate-dependent protein n=1 Tax=Phyllobacterium endophyticum TaxID=1149773 RepID=A0A2P7AKE1_9HYPH|nr:threonine/serine dehydratase [Phyllobacterium endophyticum]MBB3237090.1 threonine dehydratase [Phyllobacterium endophyticum]PSH54674.1 pyridoxal-5'-phosphate-dependent protein [Phyllobacterium endophyticum]TYR40559.1 threonine/serine dehydratase [Phyllobacterium endophyticum]
MLDNIPTADDVLLARKRLDGIAIVTPLLRSDELDRRTQGKIFVKFESLQHTGAFKFRGAFNALSQLERDKFPGGVVAYSTGNHGQAIAAVGKMLGIETKIVMPFDAPAVKIAKARKQGAEVILYDRHKETRESIAAIIAERSPVAIIPPGDHPQIIAGQGTVAVEALSQIGNSNIDVVMVPCGGGGLSAGTCLGVEASKSKAEVWAAEPSDFDDTMRSLLSGNRETNRALTGSICDALLAPTPAELPFIINKSRLSSVVTATDEEVLAAMRFAYEEFRIVVEPGGAVALAALLSDPSGAKDRTVIVVASGGNVDNGVFMRALSSPITS